MIVMMIVVVVVVVVVNVKAGRGMRISEVPTTPSQKPPPLLAGWRKLSFIFLSRPVPLMIQSSHSPYTQSMIHHPPPPTVRIRGATDTTTKEYHRHPANFPLISFQSRYNFFEPTHAVREPVAPDVLGNGGSWVVRRLRACDMTI